MHRDTYKTLLSERIMLGMAKEFVEAKRQMDCENRRASQEQYGKGPAHAEFHDLLCAAEGLAEQFMDSEESISEDFSLLPWTIEVAESKEA